MSVLSAVLAPPTPSSGFRDSAFTKNRELPLHRWVPWIAGFSAQFVDDCLENYLSNGAPPWLLDPFAGVGTTLLEGSLRGANVIGFEINPYAVLASRTKLEAFSVSPGELKRHISAYERFMEGNCPDEGSCRREPRSKAPEGFRGRTQLFSPRVERRVLTTLDFIERIADPVVADMFRLALGSVMVSVSNYSYEPSLTRRAAVDKPDVVDAPVAAVLSTKLRLMLDDIEWLRHQRSQGPRTQRKQVIQASFFTAPNQLRRREFVDLVITSPPYLNNYHYPRNTRPQLHWLGFASGSGYKAAREDESFGKFWQTVRQLPPIPLAFEFPSLARLIDTVRSLNAERGPYGGPGWANYAATYFNDTYRFCQLLNHLLKPGAVAVIVLGNSIIQGVEIKTDHFFGKIAELRGLALEDNFLIRQKRTGSSIIQSSVRVDKAATKVSLYECAIVLRKREQLA